MLNILNTFKYIFKYIFLKVNFHIIMNFCNGATYCFYINIPNHWNLQPCFLTPIPANGSCSLGGKENWVAVSHVYNESTHSYCISLQVPRVRFPDPLAKWSLYRSSMKDMKSLCYKDLRSGTLFAKTCSGWRREHEHIPFSPFFRSSGWP